MNYYYRFRNTNSKGANRGDKSTASRATAHSCFPTRVILFQDVVYDYDYDSKACNAPNHCSRSRIWGYSNHPLEQACHVVWFLGFGLVSSLYTQKAGGLYAPPALACEKK